MSRKFTDDYLRNKIEVLKKSAEKHRGDIRPGKRRFGLYRYLKDVYEVFLELRSKRIAKKAARRIINRMGLSVGKKADPIRVLIEASASFEDARQKSRWTAALKYAHGWRLSAEKLEWCFNGNGGISGCARKHTINNGGCRRPTRPKTDGSGENADQRVSSGL